MWFSQKYVPYIFAPMKNMYLLCCQIENIILLSPFKILFSPDCISLDTLYRIFTSEEFSYIFITQILLKRPKTNAGLRRWPGENILLPGTLKCTPGSFEISRVLMDKCAFLLFFILKCNWQVIFENWLLFLWLNYFMHLTLFFWHHCNLVYDWTATFFCIHLYHGNNAIKWTFNKHFIVIYR